MNKIVLYGIKFRPWKRTTACELKKEKNENEYENKIRYIDVKVPRNKTEDFILCYEAETSTQILNMIWCRYSYIRYVKNIKY